MSTYLDTSYSYMYQRYIIHISKIHHPYHHVIHHPYHHVIHQTLIKDTSYIYQLLHHTSSKLTQTIPKTCPQKRLPCSISSCFLRSHPLCSAGRSKTTWRSGEVLQFAPCPSCDKMAVPKSTTAIFQLPGTLKLILSPEPQIGNLYVFQPSTFELLVLGRVN